MTFECYANKNMANQGVIYVVKSRQMTKKECAAACVLDYRCQGVVLKKTLADKNIQCSFFLRGSTLRNNDFTEEVGSRICRHIYRDVFPPLVEKKGEEQPESGVDAVFGALLAN